MGQVIGGSRSHISSRAWLLQEDQDQYNSAIQPLYIIILLVVFWYAKLRPTQGLFLLAQVSEEKGFRGKILVARYTMPCPYTMWKYGWISQVYNVLRIVSGRKLFCLYWSPIDLLTFTDILVIWFTTLIFLSRRIPKKLITEVPSILLLPMIDATWAIIYQSHSVWPGFSKVFERVAYGWK